MDPEIMCKALCTCTSERMHVHGLWVHIRSHETEFVIM